MSKPWDRSRSVDVHPKPCFGTHISIYVYARSHVIQIRTELPKITEDSVAQVSRDKHESLADIFSLTVEDIPPMLTKHTIAVGLHMVLFLLDFVEAKDGNYVELCQMMRSYIASYLTDDERAQFLS